MTRASIARQVPARRDREGAVVDARMRRTISRGRDENDMIAGSSSRVRREGMYKHDRMTNPER